MTREIILASCAVRLVVRFLVAAILVAFGSAACVAFGQAGERRAFRRTELPCVNPR